MIVGRPARGVVTGRRLAGRLNLASALLLTTWMPAFAAAVQTTTTPAPTAPASSADRSTAPNTAEPRRTSVTIPGTALSIDLVEVPMEGGAPLWFGRTEIPWEVLDVYVHGLDQEATPSEAGDGTSPATEAVTRPSKPYISMDRGFGHHGHPAISVSAHHAVEFCRWLSATTGRRFRLPTEAERRRACARGAIDVERIAAHAWLLENAERRTHPVASLAPDAAGLFDMRGNASEWATLPDGTFVAMGGSFRDAASAADCTLAVPNDKAWNASDPQIPKSRWWLADGGFVGFRVVCEGADKDVEAVQDGGAPAAPAATERRGSHEATTPASSDEERRRAGQKEQK